MTDLSQPSQTQPAAPAKNPFQRIAGVLFAPAETFRDIARKPDILVPLLLFVAISYVTTFIAQPHLDFDAVVAQQTEVMREKNPNMSEEDVARVGRFTKGAAKVMTFVGPLLMVAWWAIVAGVVLLAIRLFGGQGTYKQALSTTLYAWVPLVIFGIIATIVIVARGMVDPTTMATVVKSNPAFLVGMKEQPLLFALLSSFDVFTIWTIVLLIIGFTEVSKGFSRAKTAVVLISLWIIMIVIKVGFAAIGAAGSKA